MTSSKNWEWADHCSPEDVTEHELFKLFGLLSIPGGCCTEAECGKCKKQSVCKASPYCLATVTPNILYKSIPDSKKELDKLKEINEAQRSKSDYVGLDNLGATCYVNSYLQMWFHTAPFRHMILTYKPPSAPNDEDDAVDTTIHQMRVLFAQMLLTTKRSLLPEAFIETLGLDPSNQQDAQEFSNLWMGLLQHRFGSSFSKLFCGSCDVSIVCDSCGQASRKPDEFFELILNVPAAEITQSPIFENSPGRRPGSVNLEDVLKRYFGNEVLDGDNAYECSFSNCGKKGKAIRQTRMEKAPAILNAQVLRFAFDPVKMTRRKLRTVISFPEHLELRREYFADDSPELKQDSLPRYRIKAILCHIGTSVVRGHYTARIRLHDGWHIFNDASVKKGDPTCGGDGGVDADESGGSSGRRFRSADAYCIVYHRVDAPQLRTDDDLTKDLAIIPDDLKKEVEAVEEHFRSDLDKRREEIRANSGVKEQIREQRLRFRREMALYIPQLNAEKTWTPGEIRKMLNGQKGGTPIFVSKEWLNDYLSLKADRDLADSFGFDESSRCCHGRFSPDEAGGVKLITKRAAEIVALELNYPRSMCTYTPEDICTTCVRIACFGMYYTARAIEVAKMLKEDLKLYDAQVNSADRKYWIVREIAEKFLELAKEAVSEAESHITEEYKQQSSITVGTGERKSSHCFGTDLATEAEVQTLSTTTKNCQDAGPRIPRMHLKNQGDREEKTFYPIRNEEHDATPKKRPRMENSDSVDLSKPVSIKSEETDISISNGLDSDFIVTTANGETVYSSSSSSATVGGVMPELPQGSIAHSRDVFMFIQKNVNEGALCSHHAIWLPTPAATGGSVSGPGRKRATSTFGMARISEASWQGVDLFFPNSMALCYPDFGVCEVCESEANNERQKHDRLREEAKRTATHLGSLVKRTHRNKIYAALRPVNLVTTRWCDLMNDWFTGKTESAKCGKRLSNVEGLCRHKRLPFSPEELADDVSSENGTWVSAKGSEWRMIKETMYVDFEVTLKPIVEKLQSNGIQNTAPVTVKSAINIIGCPGWSNGLSQVQRSGFVTGKRGGVLLGLMRGNNNTSVGRHLSRPSSEEASDAIDANEFTSKIEDIASDTTDTVPGSDANGDECIDVISEDEDIDEYDDDFASNSALSKPARGGSRGRPRSRRGKGTGPPGRAAKSRRTGWSCVPETCETCRQERIDAENEARQIKEAMASAEIPDWNGVVYVKFESNTADPTCSPTAPPTGRRSRRRMVVANRKNYALAGEMVDYDVSSTLPLVEFQMTLLRDYEMSPFEQMLYAVDEKTQERRLLTSGDESSLGKLLICENQVFILKRKDEEEEEDFVGSSACLEVDENKKSKANSRTEGFGGTLLSVLANSAPMKHLSPESPGNK